MPDISQPNPVKLIFKDREDFRSLHDGDSQSYWVVALLYAVIVTSLAGVLLSKSLSWSSAAPIYLISFIIIGWAQYSIGNGMHEAVHHNFGNKKTDLWASLLTAYPIGLTMAYRSVHLAHHQHFGTPEDPELDVYTSFPHSKIKMISRFLWFVSGIPAGLQFLGQQSGKKSDKASHSFLTFVSVQLCIIAAFYLSFGNPLYYVIFWGAPIATIGKLLSSTRLLCEHGSPTHEWVVRTISGPRWQTWVLGAFDFNYHGEHHLFPSVPYAGLQQLHQRHKAYANSHPDYRPFNGRFEFFDGGYIRLLAKWFRELPWK